MVCSTSHNMVPGKLSVHEVPRSHDDFGWLKTVDQYYVGSNNCIQRVKVTQAILSANKEISVMEKKRLVWKVEGERSDGDMKMAKRGREIDPRKLEMEFYPMEIRTNAGPLGASTFSLPHTDLMPEAQASLNGE